MSMLNRVVSKSRDDDDDSDVEFSFEGRNLRPLKVDRFGRSVPLEAKITVPPPIDESEYFVTSPQAAAAASKAAVPTAEPTALTPIHVRVTPYQPKHNPQLVRERSLRALEEARYRRQVETGEAPRLTREPTYGFLMPRDQVVGGTSDDVSAATGSKRSHYRRSLDVMQEIREERMMRFFTGN